MKYIIFLLLLIMSACSFAQIDYKGFPEWSLQKQDSTEYALYTPARLQTGCKYPVVLFMHGCCGVDNHASLRNAVDPPARMWHRFGENKQDEPTYIIAPATSRGWQQHFKNLKTVIDDLVQQHNGDPQRIYVCGFSMGGEGVFRIIQEYPGYFAAGIAMGMSFKGDSVKVKDIPLWINQGETDWYSRFLRAQVTAIRQLNGFTGDTGSVWVTGVNPMYSNFKGVGHGVQWAAASTQDLTGWAYSKINDGNRYPVVFFEPAVASTTTQPGKAVKLSVHATDADGSISKVIISVNQRVLTILKRAPYDFTFNPAAGDNLVEAMAYDDKGKASKSFIIIRTNIPPQLMSARLPAGQAGSMYDGKLSARGNGLLHFDTRDSSLLPPGITVYDDGSVRGIPAQAGSFSWPVTITDEDGEMTEFVCKLRIAVKNKADVLVTNMKTSAGNDYRLATMQKGVSPYFNFDDSVKTTATEEINFSGLSVYEGFSFIQTAASDANQAATGFLQFTIDEDATVYVAYEKLDQPASRTPAWLQAYKKESGQVIAQYRYYDVYSKPYRRGTINLPGAAAAVNGVGNNYFIIIGKPRPGSFASRKK